MAKIVILGAGPAGCSAGYHLAKSNHQVVLIDKDCFPRDKICGDGISLESVQALSTMGIYPQNIQNLASEYAPIDGLLLGISNGNSHLQSTQLQGCCIPRFVFDNLLYQKAINAGCVPRTQKITNIDRAHPELYSEFDYIIDARGIYAGEVNAIAIRAYWSIRLADFPQNLLSKAQIYFDKAFGVNGYGWIFPANVNSELVKLNVGVGVWIDEYQKSNINIIRLFNEFVQQNQATKQLLKLVVNQQKPKAYPLATAKRANTVSNSKVLKIGDAANLTDPLTGEGIANAIFSGLYVTQAINMSANPESTSENWQRLYQLYFEEDINTALQIKSVRKFFFMNELLIWFMNKNEKFAEQVTYTFVGLIPYKKLFF